MTLYNEEYEMCLLGSMLMDNEIIPDILSEVRKDFFWFSINKEIFEYISHLYNEGKNVDITVVSAKFPRKIDYVAELTNKVASTSNVNFYIEQVTKLYLARESQKLIKDSLSSLTPDNVIKTISELDNNLVNLSTGLSATKETTNRTILVDFINFLDASLKSKEKYIGLETGFHQLDDLLDGLPSKTYITLAARPSIGKTAFAISLLQGLALKKIPCGIFSLEMTNMSLIKRMVSSMTGISSFYMNHGIAMQTQSLVQKINIAMQKIYEMEIYMFDSTYSKYINQLDQIMAHIRTLAKKGVKVFFIDHIGLVKHPDKQLKRCEQVGDITFQLHQLAQQLDVTIIGLNQLKRDAEGKKPTLADLRESGDIEQNSDICMFLHRDRAQGQEIRIPTELLILKNRDGGVGTINLDFIPKFTKFVESAEEKEQIA